MYEIILIAIGVAGLAWLFASSRESTARTLWRPGDQALMVFRLLIGGLTIYVLLTAGGIATVLGVIAAFFAGLHLYFSRPEDDVGRLGFPLRWFSATMSKIEGLLVGGR